MSTKITTSQEIQIIRPYQRNIKGVVLRYIETLETFSENGLAVTHFSTADDIPIQVKGYGVDGIRLRKSMPGEHYKFDYLVARPVLNSYFYYGPLNIEFVVTRCTQFTLVPPPTAIFTRAKADWTKAKMPPVEEFLQTFECPVCIELMHPPMTQCLNGHVICTHCRARMPTCPLCRRPIGRFRHEFYTCISVYIVGVARNLNMEKIYYMLFSKEGEKHEKSNNCF